MVGIERFLIHLKLLLVEKCLFFDKRKFRKYDK
jgi:hypothetical protein